MGKQTVEVEVPDGYEAVGYRPPTKGEWFIDSTGRIQRALFDHDRTSCRVLVRLSWQWPEWLANAEWLAMDPDGEWFAFFDEPYIHEESDDEDDEPTGWVSNKSYAWCVWDDYSPFAFTPPPCDDWRQSKRRNPNL